MVRIDESNISTTEDRSMVGYSSALTRQSLECFVGIAPRAPGLGMLSGRTGLKHQPTQAKPRAARAKAWATFPWPFGPSIRNSRRDIAWAKADPLRRQGNLSRVVARNVVNSAKMPTCLT
jgi:hypothetical protein